MIDNATQRNATIYRARVARIHAARTITAHQRSLVTSAAAMASSASTTRNAPPFLAKTANASLTAVTCHLSTIPGDATESGALWALNANREYAIKDIALAMPLARQTFCREMHARGFRVSSGMSARQNSAREELAVQEVIARVLQQHIQINAKESYVYLIKNAKILMEHNLALQGCAVET